MARKIFFSFHYERDSWRAGQVRNCNVVASEDQYGFIDAADWESIKKKGDAAIKGWIDDQLKNTSVTVVLIGAETASREWVQHEILRSWNRGNGILGIRIRNIKDQEKKTDTPGRNPFDDFTIGEKKLSTVVKLYDPSYKRSSNVYNYIKENIADWVEQAIQIRNSY